MKKISKSKEVWRTLLSEEQYRVCREGGTERAFSGELYRCQEPGTYLCACCRHPLFSSKAKFDSGCGWPSFSETIDPVCVEYHEDLSHGMNRIEVRCSRCDAHLGHVFDDGPAPKGKRYCINSISLELQRTAENKNE